MNYLIIIGIGYMLVPLWGNAQASTLEKSGGVTNNPMQVVGQLAVYTPAPTDDGRHLPTDTPQLTYTPFPTFTPQPTYTAFLPWSVVSPTVTKVPFEPSQANFVFSYYNPDLVKDDYEKYQANCHIDNVLRSPDGSRVVGCRDTTASGLPWSRFYMYYTTDTPQFVGGVAVPYYPNTYNPLYPMGSVLTVESPSIIAGDYLVIDICPACDDFVFDKNVLFLDFVAKGLPDGVTFWTPVKVSKVLYPWEVGE